MGMPNAAFYTLLKSLKSVCSNANYKEPVAGRYNYVSRSL